MPPTQRPTPSPMDFTKSLVSTLRSKYLSMITLIQINPTENPPRNFNTRSNSETVIDAFVYVLLALVLVVFDLKHAFDGLLLGWIGAHLPSAGL